MKQDFPFRAIMAYMLCYLMFMGSVSAKGVEDEAAVLFQKKQYKEALDIWYGLVKSGNAGAGIYYNIGVSESMLNHTPEAVLAFEKALRFKPSDKRILNALSEERKKIVNGVMPVQTFFLSRWLQAMLSFLRPGYWAMTGLATFLVLIIWIIQRKERPQKRRDTERKTALAMFLAGLVFISFAWLSYRQIYRTDEAIIASQCAFRLAPSEESPQVRVIYPGEKVFVSDRIGDWYQVHLLNLDEGWVRSEFLDFIIIDGEKPAKGL